MTRVLFVCALTLGISVVGAASAAAQDAFMLIPGIPGDSTVAGRENWIAIASLSQSLNVDVKKNACAVAVSKGADRSGPLLWVAAATGQVFPTVRIELVRTGGDGSPFKFYEILLTDARVAHIATGSSGPTFTEQVGLVGDSIRLTLFRQNADGSVGQAATGQVSCR